MISLLFTTMKTKENRWLLQRIFDQNFLQIDHRIINLASVIVINLWIDTFQMITKGQMKRFSFTWIDWIEKIVILLGWWQWWSSQHRIGTHHAMEPKLASLSVCFLLVNVCYTFDVTLLDDRDKRKKERKKELQRTEKWREKKRKYLKKKKRWRCWEW